LDVLKKTQKNKGCETVLRTWLPYPAIWRSCRASLLAASLVGGSWL